MKTTTVVSAQLWCACAVTPFRILPTATALVHLTTVTEGFSWLEKMKSQILAFSWRNKIPFSEKDDLSGLKTKLSFYWSLLRLSSHYFGPNLFYRVLINGAKSAARKVNRILRIVFFFFFFSKKVQTRTLIKEQVPKAHRVHYWNQETFGGVLLYRMPEGKKKLWGEEIAQVTSQR